MEILFHNKNTQNTRKSPNNLSSIQQERSLKHNINWELEALYKTQVYSTQFIAFNGIIRFSERELITSVISNFPYNIWSLSDTQPHPLFPQIINHLIWKAQKNIFGQGNSTVFWTFFEIRCSFYFDRYHYSLLYNFVSRDNVPSLTHFHASVWSCFLFIITMFISFYSEQLWCHSQQKGGYILMVSKGLSSPLIKC